MRVALLSSYPPTWDEAPSSRLLHLAAELAGAGHDVRVVGSETEMPAKVDGVDVFSLPYNALEEIEKPLFDTDELETEKEYVLKKLGLTEEEFQEIMRLPVKSHLDYPNSQWMYKGLSRLRTVVKGKAER